MMTGNFGIDERKTGFVIIIGLFSGLMLTGCSAEAEAPTSKSLTAAAISALETSAGRYEFTPTTCVIYSQNGLDDIEIQGPGTTPDGEKFFFELSSTANAMSIDLGVDGPFASSDRQLKAGRFDSQEFTIVTSGRQLSITDLMLVDENGALIDDGASLSIDCGAL